MIEFTLAIMAGGKSSRMGTDKSFVELLDKPMIEHLIERTSDLGQSATILITNQPDDYAHLQFPMYADVIPEKGSLGGIYTALYHSQTPYTLVLACDMPFVQPKLLQYLIQVTEKGDFDVVVPRVNSYPQGFHAIYHQRCLPHIKQKLDEDRLKVIGFYDKVIVRTIDEDEYQEFDTHRLSFLNINTPEELQEAQQYLNISRKDNQYEN